MSENGGMGYLMAEQNTITVRPCKITAWAHQMAGLTAIESADRMGISDRQVERYRAEMAEYMGKPIDLSALRKGICALLPDAMGSMQDLLKGRDSPATIAYFKGLGLFIDKSEVKRSADESNKQPTERLEAEVVELISESEEPGKVKAG